MKTATFLLPPLLLFLAFSCQSETSIALNRAESLLQDRPDSALLLLDAIPRKNLTTTKMTARHALLKSAALDKNYIDVDSDSLTRPAIDYYSTHKNKKYEMLAWYYLGLVQMNARSFAASVVALEASERLAVALEDHYQMGLIKRYEARLFKLTNNIPEAIEYGKQSVEHFDLANRELYKAYAELDLAIDYMNARFYDKADSLLDYIRATYDRPALNSYCNVHQAGILIEKELSPEKVIALYKATPTRYYNLQDYGYLAIAYDKVGQSDSSDHWFSQGYSLCKDQADSATIDYMKSKVEISRGRHETAFRLIDHAAFVQDSLTRVLLHQSISGAQRDYYKSETLLKEEKIQSMRQRSILRLLLGLFLVTLSVLASVSYARKKDGQLQEQMARLALEERELERVSWDNAHLVGTLFRKKIDHLDKLCESYFTLEDGKQKDIVFKQVKECAAQMRKDEGLYLALEEDLDLYCNGIMAKLRSQVPRIRGENLRTIMLFFAGFSYEMVLILLNKHSIESLKTARSRFRREIREADAPDAEFFLRMLEMKKRSQAGANENVGVS